MKILFVFLNLIFTFCLAKTNNNIAVPNEYFIAEVPNLPLIGPDRVSWVFVRPPKIWIMNQIIDLSEIKWPQWDTSQHPLSIVPGHNDIYLILFLYCKLFILL